MVIPTYAPDSEKHINIVKCPLSLSPTHKHTYVYIYLTRRQATSVISTVDKRVNESWKQLSVLHFLVILHENLTFG